MVDEYDDAKDEVHSVIDKLDSRLLDENYKSLLAAAIIDHLEDEGYLKERTRCIWGNPQRTVDCDNIAVIGRDYCSDHLT
jgi:DNA-directed RNA polymerase specialized sigma54-like protein